MTQGLADDLYLQWLYRQIASVHKNPSRTYWSIARQLYTTEFIWFIPNDDNRVEDGRELREEFMREEGIDADISQEWLHLGCSMLEMLIALSRRLSFAAEGQPRAWFWHLMKNLGLDEINDAVQPYPEVRVSNVCDRVIFRTYDKNGHGGLFPLQNAQENQQKVEIWYQLAAYLLQ